MTANTNAAITPAVGHLVSIMQNTHETARKRLDAAQCLLDFETPEPVVAKAKQFLERVMQNPKKFRTEHRLLAGRLLRKVEARKVAQKSVGAEISPAWRETMRRLKVAKRRLRLMDAGLWPAPAGWDADLLSPEPVEP